MKNSIRIPLLLLRIAIGWHFLFEGISKLLLPSWSSELFLRGSYGFLSGFYHWMASDPGMIRVIDFLNIWGLILLGTGLFLGILIRFSSVSAILLLALYYFAYPPFGSDYGGMQLEGHYWIINNNLLEIIALLIVLAFPVREYSLLKVFPSGFFRKPDRSGGNEERGADPEDNSTSFERRRELLKGLAVLPIFGGVLAGSISRQKSVDPDTYSGATLALKGADISELKGKLPSGKIGDLEVSRLYMGSNLLTGFAHARDLHYTRQLMRQYNTQDKLIETFALAEQAGINMTNMGLPSFKLFNRFKKITGSKMMTCVQTKIDLEGNDRMIYFKQAMDYGATTMYVHGSWGDDLCQNNRLDLIQEAVEFASSQGYPAGVGCHSIRVISACEEYGINPDYYFKTMHHDRYWSAHPRENREEFSIKGPDHKNHPDHNQYFDNIWDIFPEQTIDVISRVKVPVIGFKVLAAGAIMPEDGFRYAFESGADFICVGMFDYQIVEDVNIVLDILGGELNRSRPWYS